MKAASGALLGSNKVPTLLMTLVKLQGEWLQRVASDRKLVSTFLATSNVLAGTCIGFLGHPAVRDLEFDLCILDEASKATATEAFVPLSRASQWVMVGDTRQLPPMDEEILRKPDLMARYDLDEEFVRTTLFDRLVQATKPPIRHLLTEQYRMIRPIGDMISTVFYDGELRSPNTDGLVPASNYSANQFCGSTQPHSAKTAMKTTKNQGSRAAATAPKPKSYLNA